MKLSEAIRDYVVLRRSLGQRFAKSAYELGLFCRHHGDVEITEVDPERVRACLQARRGPPRFLHHHYYLLTGFFRFATTRGFLPKSPLPVKAPRAPRTSTPYIYSQAEARRVLDAIAGYDDPRCRIDPATFRVLFLLLYATGLRIGEALALTLADVDLDESFLLIRESKFYKTRLVPMGPDLASVVRGHVVRRKAARGGLHAPLLATRRGAHIRRATAETYFRRICRRADIARRDGARFQPRLHDLRHTFAVTRVVSWYRSGADVQLLLPKLATYLGHVNLTGTQRYLTLTVELLREANLRFAHYALGEHHE